MLGFSPPCLAPELGLGKIRAASGVSGAKFKSCGAGMVLNGGPAGRPDLLVSRVNGREFFCRDIDKLSRHAAGDQHIGMVLGYELVILHPKLGIGSLRRGVE